MNMFKPTEANTPQEYLNAIEDEQRRTEVTELFNLIKKVAPKGTDCKLFGSMIGFSSYDYSTKSGSSGEWFKVGLASQKRYISVYICVVVNDQYLAEAHTKDFPKASIGKSCIRFKKIADIDLKKLEALIKEAFKHPGLSS